MTSLMKEIPFADTLGPILLAAILWSSAHIFLVAPNIIAPRLSEKFYQPQCEVGIQQAWHKALAVEQFKRQEQVERKRAELRHKRQMAEHLIEKSFGPLGQHLKQLGIFDALEMPQLPKSTRKPQDQAKISLSAQNFCSCVITNLLGNQFATGLYSASFRFWKPENIQKLEALGSGHIKFSQCPAPNFLG